MNEQSTPGQSTPGQSAPGQSRGDGRTVRDATYDALRATGMTRMFSNPGSTEVPFLVDLPDDIDFVLALHEASAVGIATGHALATGRATAALLHTTAGLGNAVAAIATARVNRAPVVVLVGQQDRRHLAFEPFLTGRLTGLAGDYPLAVLEPVWSGDVPSAVRRAAHLAEWGRGPVMVIIPMDDWDAPEVPDAHAAADQVLTAAAVPELAPLVAAVSGAKTPVLVAGAGVDTVDGWAAVAALADRIDAGVWVEPFGARAGFDQTHPRYQGQLPADRPRLRQALAGADLVLVLGTSFLRQYPYQPGPLNEQQTTVVVVTDDAAQAVRSPASLAVVADPAATAAALASQLPQRSVPTAEPATTATHNYQAAGSGPLTPEDVFAVLAEHLPEQATLVEESPSSRPALQAMVPARRPMGFVSAAMGGLGFAMPAAIGLRMGDPQRPVIAVVGDGSSLYAVQSLWTAAHRSVGVVLLVLKNGRYAVMDRLADRRGGTAPWPAFPEVSLAKLADGFGVDVAQISDREQLAAILPGLCTGLADRTTPLLVEIEVATSTHFQP